MARIRTIKPEFWADEKMGACDPLTRLVFLGLISLADDAGRLVDSVKQIDAALFPYTDESSRDAIEILDRMDRVRRGVSASGQRLIQIVNWERHQKIDNRNKYTLPEIAQQHARPQQVADSSPDPIEDLSRVERDDSVTTFDLRPTTNDQDLKSQALSDEPAVRPPEPPATALVRTNGKHPPSRIAAVVSDDMALAEQKAARRKARDAIFADAASVVFEYWRSRLGHKQTLYDDKREALICRQLHHGSTLSDLLFAVDGVATDDWAMGRDARSPGRRDQLDVLFRDRGQIEKYASKVPAFEHGDMHPMAAKLQQEYQAASAGGGT